LFFDTPTCFCPDGEGAVRMVPDGRGLRGHYDKPSWICKGKKIRM